MAHRFITFLLLGLLITSASAAPNLLKNPDFDQWRQYWGTNADNWDGGKRGRIKFDGSDMYYNWAWTNGRGIWQGAAQGNTIIIQPDTTYTMTATVRSDVNCEGVELKMEAIGGGKFQLNLTQFLFPQSDKGVNPGAWHTYGITWESNSNPAMVGKSMTVVIKLVDNGDFGNFGQCACTHVELTAKSNLASNPNPINGSTWVDTLSPLSWQSGDSTQTTNGHIVYVDPNKAKVDARTGCLYQGEVTSAPSFTAPAPWDWETTYYWAVDEVNGVDTWPGHTWSFTVRGEPVPPQMDLWIQDVEETKATVSMLCYDEGNEPGTAWFMLRGDYEDDWNYHNAGIADEDGQLIVETFKNLLPGTTYEVSGGIGHVGGEAEKGLLFTTLGERPPLFIYRQPKGSVVRLGGKVSLAVKAVSDSDSIHYQWLRTTAVGIAIVGGDSPVLNIVPMTEEDAGSYYCIVTADGVSEVAISDTVELGIRRLMGHWKMDGDLTDASGNGFDGGMKDESTFPAFVPAPFMNNGQALSVRPHAKNYAVIPNTEQAFKFLKDGFTFSCWMRCRANNQWNCLISKQKRATSPWYGYLLSTDNQGKVRFTFRNGKTVISSKAVKDGNWHMITGTYSAPEKTIRIYIDGKFEASGRLNKPIPGSDMPVTIGAEDKDGIAIFNGDLDDARIYNYPLSPGEITTILAEGKWGPQK